MSHIKLSELQSQIAQCLKQSLPKSLWIIAEINELSVNFKGHCYLELIEKDEKSTNIVAKQRATIWSYSYNLINSYFKAETGIPLQAGLKVLVQCSVEFHALYGMSLNISNIDPIYTLGEEEKQRREIIERLQREGVIDMNKSLEFPVLLQRIAVISSETAAGYQDFMHSLHTNREQLAFSTTLFAAAMQGQDVEHSVVAALERIFEHEENFDAVVIIRGGGAKTDLRWFDNYSIAAHIAQFPLPVITGIGHDKDSSIADLVAHTTLKTPTAVAEFLIDHQNEVLQEWKDLQQRLSAAGTAIVETHTVRLQEYTNTIQLHAQHRIESENLRLQYTHNRMQNAAKNSVHTEIRHIENLHKNLQHATLQNLRVHKGNLELYEAKIAANSIDSILAKGFTLTTNAAGTRLRSKHNIQPGEVLRSYFADGVVESTVID
ncbi:MAG: exodeoxyribonuclease VII large subunit [Bacteroidales bacterium]|jgi:exodeoxyribonuclease VII large subunit|nr:exodeoxyribonuclease VII large subunit [Bacteroidales bacterium]